MLAITTNPYLLLETKQHPDFNKYQTKHNQLKTDKQLIHVLKTRPFQISIYKSLEQLINLDNRTLRIFKMGI